MSQKLIKGTIGVILIFWLLLALVTVAFTGAIIWLIYTIIAHPEIVAAWFHRLTT